MIDSACLIMRIKRISDTFENVAIIKKANVYFGGQVTSRTVQFADGSKKTLGFMQAGNYEFGTEASERMEILGGVMNINLANSDEWNTYVDRQASEVEGNSKFSLKVPQGGKDYCCTYMP